MATVSDRRRAIPLRGVDIESREILPQIRGVIHRGTGNFVGRTVSGGSMNI
jgi:hypothetical protein